MHDLGPGAPAARARTTPSEAPADGARTTPSAAAADGAGTAEEQARRLVIELITRHAESLLRLARRHSLCPDAAQGAYQLA